MTGKQKRQLTMFYLFAHADGRCSEEEERRLDSIAKSFDTSDKDMRDIKEEVSRIYRGDHISDTFIIEAYDEFEGCTDFTSRIIAAIDGYESYSSRPYYKPHSQYTASSLFAGWFAFSDEDKLFSIWTMISLGYPDNEYSENEKRIVNHLVEKWSIDSSTVSAMIDTVETMLALEKKKLWAKSTSMSDDDINRIIADADADIKRLFHTIEVTISEAEIK